MNNKCWPISWTFLTNRGKNEDEDEKIWENEFNIWVFYIKIRLSGSFHGNLLKKNLTHFLGQVLTSQGKNKDEDEKIWENEFNFWILHIKIRLSGSFAENLRKKNMTFLTNRGKIKGGKMISIFEFPYQNKVIRNFS